MKLRLSVVTVFLALLAATFFATGGDAQSNTVKKIAEGVWFREGDMQQGHSNNIIIEMKDYLIVVDANYPSVARLALADAKKLSAKPVKYVFITHHHGDHAYGSAVWTSAGATTIAYKLVTEEMSRYEPARWQAAAKKRADVAEMGRDAPERPQQTFDRSPYILKDSTREVQLLYFGWAHTRGDSFVWLPKEKILCTGDASTNGPYNNTADANLGNWPNVLAAAEKFEPQFVLPGHGPAGGAEILSGQANFMRELVRAVRQEVAQGKKLEDIVTVKDGKAVATSVKLPSSVEHWVSSSLAGHVLNAYNEVTQNRPVGELPHP